jgi:hypothetical protein
MFWQEGAALSAHAAMRLLTQRALAEGAAPGRRMSAA